MMDTNTVHIDIVKAQADRIKQLEGYFNSPDIAMALYQGDKVGVLISRPISTEPLVYRVKYVAGDKTGIEAKGSHDELTFLDPVVVTTQSYIQGLTDRIKELEHAAKDA